MKVSRNIAHTILWICALYTIGSVTHCVVTILDSLVWTFDPSPRWLDEFAQYSRYPVFLSHSLNLFIYFKYNAVFRQVIMGFVRRHFKLFATKTSALPHSVSHS